MAKENRIIIGLTGSFGSGCSNIAAILQERAFKVISLSSFLNAEVLKRNIPLNSLLKQDKRRVLQDIGNEIRKSDNGALIKMCLPQIVAEQETNFVIESLKNPGEIKELKRIPNSYIIAIDTSFDVRRNRILKTEYDNNLNQFEKDDIRERDEGIDNGQRVQECVDLADILINNDKENNTPKEKELFKVDTVNKYIDLILDPGSRYPTDMELWMNNAYSISLKSPCIKRQVGAVLVKEGCLISGGFNNVPAGEEPCEDEFDGQCYRDIIRSKIKYCSICKAELDKDFDCTKVGCEYNKTKINKLLDKCRSLHAEENAILQAAKLGGLSLKDATLYTTTYPCKLCANKIIAVGIREVIYIESYPDPQSVVFFKKHQAQVNITKFQGVKVAAFYSLYKESIK